MRSAKGAARTAKRGRNPIAPGCPLGPVLREFLQTAAFALAICVSFGLPANAGDREFKDVVHAISEQFQTHPIHIPMIGLAKFVVQVAHPAGTKQLDIAIFQDLDETKGSGRDLLESIRFAVGRQWQPFVQVRGERNNNVLVYMVGAGNDVRLLVVTAQHDQAVVVEVKTNPEALQRWMRSPGDMSKQWGRDHDELRD